MKFFLWVVIFMLLTVALVMFILMLPANAQLPNPKLTPGAVRTTRAAEICARSFRTRPFRHTTEATKEFVCKEYGYYNYCPLRHKMEIDHLIPLELGGADEISNLWVELARYPDGSPGYHVKDGLETHLRWMVCKKQITLPRAQECLWDNWIACYRRLMEKK